MRSKVMLFTGNMGLLKAFFGEPNISITNDVVFAKEEHVAEKRQRAFKMNLVGSLKARFEEEILSLFSFFDKRPVPNIFLFAEDMNLRFLEDFIPLTKKAKRTKSTVWVLVSAGASDLDTIEWFFQKEGVPYKIIPKGAKPETVVSLVKEVTDDINKKTK